MDEIREIASYPVIVLRVQVESHTLSLRPAVKAFELLRFPGHTFFQVAIRCFLCCTESVDYLDSVKDCTSHALKALCPQLVYDLRRDGCFECTLIPPLQDNASCQKAAEAFIRRLKEVEIGDPPIIVSISPACEKRSLTKLKNLGPPGISPGDPKQTSIEQMVSDFVQYVSDDLNARLNTHALVQKVEHQRQLPHVRRSEELEWQLPKRKSESISNYVEKLEDLAKARQFRSRADTLDFLIGAIFHCGSSLPTLAGDHDVLGSSASRTRRTRKGRASLVCAIVDGLLSSWGGRAYVLFHPLAGSQTWYRSLRDLSQENREIFLVMAISELKKLEIFKDIRTTTCAFDPEIEMAKLLSIEESSVRGLLLPSRPQLQNEADYASVIDGSDTNDSTLSNSLQRSNMDPTSTTKVRRPNTVFDLGPEIAFIHRTKPKNQRSYSWPLFTIIYEGDVVKATNLITARQASASDVDPYGLGTSYYAAYYCLKNLGLEAALNMCRALVGLGAMLDDQDEIGNSALETLIDGILVSRAMEGRTRDILDYLCQAAMLVKRDTSILWQDYVETRGFSRVHKVLLQIDDHYPNLEAYLDNILPDSLDIDIQDSRGRSALAWAAEYGWTEAASLLIQHGANPKQSRQSCYGDLPLLHLALAGSNKTNGGHGSMNIIKLLVEAGADVNSRDHEGWTPFHVAASWNNYFAIRKLQEVAMVDHAAMTWAGENAVDLSGNPTFFKCCLSTEFT